MTTQTVVKLADAEDAVEIELADGSVLTVTGDGIAALFLDPEDDEADTVVNMYIPEDNGEDY